MGRGQASRSEAPPAARARRLERHRTRLVAGILAIAAVAGLAALAWRTLRPAGVKRDPELSVLIVSVDTLRADALGCYGRRDARTPWIDRLAAEGVRFETARAHNVVTLPSHANLLSGQYPLRHGVHDNTGFRFPADRADARHDPPRAGLAHRGLRQRVPARFPVRPRPGLRRLRRPAGGSGDDRLRDAREAGHRDGARGAAVDRFRPRPEVVRLRPPVRAALPVRASRPARLELCRRALPGRGGGGGCRPGAAPRAAPRGGHGRAGPRRLHLRPRRVARRARRGDARHLRLRGDPARAPRPSRAGAPARESRPHPRSARRRRPDRPRPPGPPGARRPAGAEPPAAHRRARGRGARELPRVAEPVAQPRLGAAPRGRRRRAEVRRPAAPGDLRPRRRPRRAEEPRRLAAAGARPPAWTPRPAEDGGGGGRRQGAGGRVRPGAPARARLRLRRRPVGEVRAPPRRTTPRASSRSTPASRT